MEGPGRSERGGVEETDVGLGVRGGDHLAPTGATSSLATDVLDLDHGIILSDTLNSRLPRSSSLSRPASSSHSAVTSTQSGMGLFTSPITPTAVTTSTSAGAVDHLLKLQSQLKDAVNSLPTVAAAQSADDESGSSASSHDSCSTCSTATSRSSSSSEISAKMPIPPPPSVDLRIPPTPAPAPPPVPAAIVKRRSSLKKMRSFLTFTPARATSIPLPTPTPVVPSSPKLSRKAPAPVTIPPPQSSQFSPISPASPLSFEQFYAIPDTVAATVFPSTSPGGLASVRGSPEMSLTSIPGSPSSSETTSATLGLGMVVESPVSPRKQRNSVPAPAKEDELGRKALLRSQKRLHALAELVETERSYLLSLQSLVNVYFRALPTLSLLLPSELATVTRNAKALLELHERIGAAITKVEQQYRKATASVPSSSIVRRAAAQLAQVFLDELPNMKLYNDFCAKHNEALDLVRGLEESADWDDFERQCSNNRPTPQPERFAISPWSFSPPSTSVSLPPLRTNSDPSSSRVTSFPVARPATVTASGDKLRFADFAIQPIQRICRYPLVFASLLANFDDIEGPERVAVDVDEDGEKEREAEQKDVVYRAWEGVRKVAEGVDAARRAREAELRTRLVAARMDFQTPINSAFCSVLGGTLLVGTLHVLHRQTSSSPHVTAQASTVKYLGCFLYRSHLVIVKVQKKEQYEPREWLPLRLFEIADVNDHDALIPHSIRLSYRTHHFDLGAACPAEKAVWFSRLKATQTAARAVWDRQALDSEGHSTLFDETLVSSIHAEPSRHQRSQSMPGPVSPVLAATASSYFEEQHPLPPTASPAHSPTMTHFPPSFPIPRHASSRLSTLLGRTPSSQRSTIDQRVADVLSEEIVVARSQPAPPPAAASSSANFHGPTSFRHRTLSSGASTPSVGRMSLRPTIMKDKERRRMSWIDLDAGGALDVAWRGAIGYDADHAQIYHDQSTEKKWSHTLRRGRATFSLDGGKGMSASSTSSGSSVSAAPRVDNNRASLSSTIKARPALKDIDVGGLTWKNRAKSTSHLVSSHT